MAWKDCLEPLRCLDPDFISFFVHFRVLVVFVFVK